MGQPFPIQPVFTGMVQDAPRDALPNGALWNCVDFIPRLIGAPIRKRGGWSYSSAALGASTAAQAVQYAPFSAGAKNLAVAGDNHLYSWVDGGSATDIGAVFATIQNPVFHRNLSIITASDGTTAPKSYDGTTLQNLAGSPPAGKFAVVYKDRTLLLNSDANPNRVAFGPAGNPAGTWNTTTSWIDTSAPCVGAAALTSSVLIFHSDQVERLRGAIPPPNTDMILEPLFAVGCIDARSIVPYNDKILWADKYGVYISDGATVRDVAADAGIKAYWRGLFPFGTTYSVGGGILRDLYFLTIHNGTTFVDALCFDLLGRTVWRISNLNGVAFARSGGGSEESFVALADNGRIAKLSSMLSPAGANKADANGTNVLPYFETGYFRGFQRWHRKWLPAQSLQAWDYVYPNYSLVDAASDNPVLTVSYTKSPDSPSSYTAISPTVAETTSGAQVGRKRLPLRFSSTGVAFKVAQTNASADTRLFSLEAEYAPREGSHL